MKMELGEIKPSFGVTIPATPHGLPARWVRAGGFLAMGSLVVQNGFPISAGFLQGLDILDVLLAVCFAADLLLAGRQEGWKKVLQLRKFELAFLALFILFLGLATLLSEQTMAPIVRFFHLQTSGSLLLNIVDGYLVISVAIQLLRGAQRLVGRGVRPELILGGSFGALILVGTLLLLLPNSSAKPAEPISLLDAFFTATSAACVTGLVVRDTGADFSGFGQMVILGVFQIGGLGIITFVAFLSVFSARTLPVRQLLAFRQMVNAPALSDLKRQLVGILAITALIELLGVIALFNFIDSDGDALERLKWSVFHAVSAFCNAGFALQANSLEPQAFNAPMIFTIMLLIILGGLGFLSVSELLSYRFTRATVFRRFSFFRRIHSGQPSDRLSAQTRLALTVTGLLLVAGFVFFWALESSAILRERSWSESLLLSAFQSVTTRTAGFNTVPINELRDATLVFLIMLMVIGANPVSTGGGIKTVSFGILLLALRSMVTRRDRVEAFGRTIPVRTLFAALTVFVIYVLCAAAGIFLLALFDPGMPLQDQAFEVISALSTVGLSTGITPNLSPASKLVICAAMFIGRIGPISLVLSIFQNRTTLEYEFPEEEVVVG